MAYLRRRLRMAWGAIGRSPSDRLLVDDANDDVLLIDDTNTDVLLVQD